MPQKSRLAVLISGNGSNLQAILDACAVGQLQAEVVLVVSSRADAFGLTRAARAEVPTLVLERGEGQERAAYDAVLAEKVSGVRPDWVVLAGWMRVLTMSFLGRFPNRVVNLHPALPGAFPGTHAIERAFAAWQKGEIDHTGVMVHLVPDEEVDLGPVLAKETILFRAGESLDEFEARVHELEHRLLVDTLRTLLR
jgi:formyltetrahydrofolate-dependent phosphoribosylglycinamide formyltransferase